VRGAGLADDGFDPARPGQSAALVVIAAISEQPVGLGQGRRGLPATGLAWRLEQWDPLRDVVAVAAGERDRERDPDRVR
jgi:hypothetical protein